MERSIDRATDYQAQFGGDRVRSYLASTQMALGNLGSVDRKAAENIPIRALRNNGRKSAEIEAPPRFSKPFMKVIGDAIDKGHISARRTAKLLHTTIDELQDLLDVHGVDCVIGL